MSTPFDEAEFLEGIPPALLARVKEAPEFYEPFAALPSDLHLFFALFNLLERDRGTAGILLEQLSVMVSSWAEDAAGRQAPAMPGWEPDNLQSMIAFLNARHRRRSPRLYPHDFLEVCRRHQPGARYMFRRYGWESWYSFWYAKLFVSDSGGEYDLFSRWHTANHEFVRCPNRIHVEISAGPGAGTGCALPSGPTAGLRPKRMSEPRFVSLIDSFPDLKWINLLSLSGGNALRGHFDTLVAHVRARHVSVNVIADLDHFREDPALFLVDRGVNSLLISWDASRIDPQATSGVDSGLERVRESLQELRAYKSEAGSPFPEINHRILVPEGRWEEAPQFLDLVHALGGVGPRQKVQFTQKRPCPAGPRNVLGERGTPPEWLLELFSKAIALGVFLELHPGMTQPHPVSTCSAWATPFITVEGDVLHDRVASPAAHRKQIGAVCFGNLFETPFHEIWGSEPYRGFRRCVTAPEEPLPRQCTACREFDAHSRAARYGVLEPDGSVTAPARFSRQGEG